MARPEKKFTAGFVAILILFISLTFYAARYQQHGVTDEDLLPQEITLHYDTEYCAFKLTALSHDYHYLQENLQKSRQLIAATPNALENETTVIAIEQTELTKVKNAFYGYKELCDEFDKNPTKDTCEQFINDAQRYEVESKTEPPVLDPFGVSDHTRSERILTQLKEICAGK